MHSLDKREASFRLPSCSVLFVTPFLNNIDQRCIKFQLTRRGSTQTRS